MDDIYRTEYVVEYDKKSHLFELHRNKWRNDEIYDSEIIDYADRLKEKEIMSMMKLLIEATESISEE